MKMNTLDRLQWVLECIGSPDGEALLEGYKPEKYVESVANGLSIAEAGCDPIVHMREFQKNGVLPADLVRHILST